jgi:hypothetical protein
MRCALCDEVLPQLAGSARRRGRGRRLRHADGAPRARARAEVGSTGAEDALARPAASIAPLRFGAGPKGKVESRWPRSPVVGTSVAAEGFADHGAGMLVADDAPAIASGSRGCQDDLLWQRLSDGGRALIDEVCGPARCDRELDVLEFLSPHDAA